MVKGFEKETQPLTKKELELLPVLLNGFSRYIGKKNTVKSHQIESRMKGNGVTISGVTVRKITSHIRRNGLAPICASNDGYYTASTQEELENQITSLQQRASALLADAEGLKKLRETFTK